MATNDSINIDAKKPNAKPETGTPYDDVFRTLLVDCPELVIPLINEAFGEHYNRDEKVTVHHNEFFIVGDDKRVTDSHIGIRQKKYHAECQSSTDGTLMRVTIKVPGGSAGYEIPVLKVPEYTLEEIMEKELYFLIPFHLFRYEKKLKIYENDKTRLEELKDAYRQIVRYLDRKMEEGKLTALQRWVIQETTKKVAENLAVHHKKVQEGVAEIMGGQILELECVKQWNARFEEGREEGENLLSTLIQRLIADARTEDIELALEDASARKKLYKEYGIAPQ